MFKPYNPNDYTYVDTRDVPDDYKYAEYEIPSGPGSLVYFEIGDGMPEFYKTQPLVMLRDIPELAHILNSPKKGDIVTFVGWDYAPYDNRNYKYPLLYNYHNIRVRSLDDNTWKTSPMNVAPSTIDNTAEYLMFSANHLKEVQQNLDNSSYLIVALQNEIQKLKLQLTFFQKFSSVWHKKARSLRHLIRHGVINAPSSEEVARTEAEIREMNRQDRLKKIAEYEKISGVSSEKFLELWNNGEIEDSFETNHWFDLLSRE